MFNKILIIVLFVSILTLLCVCILKIHKNFNKIKYMETFITKKNNEKSYASVDNVFKNKKFSLDCCPSVYSSDKGCLCLTESQQQDLSNRGANRSAKKFDNATFKDF